MLHVHIKCFTRKNSASALKRKHQVLPQLRPIDTFDFVSVF